MVQRKDAEPKKKDWLKQHLDRFDRENPIIKTRYYAVEITPAKNVRIANGDGHGGSTYKWEGPFENRVSEYSEDKAVVQKFLDAHVADEGKTLAIRSDHLRRSTTERWM